MRTNPNQTRPTNPAKIFIEWAGKADQGYLFYYDKEAKKKCQLPFPLAFMLLDELSVIKGFNDPLQCGIYSNEVRNTTKDILHVKSFKPGVVINGLYQDIKNDLKAAGAKYNKSLYIAVTGKESTMICNLCLKGVGFSAWVDFCKGNTQLYEEGIIITGAVDEVTKLGTFKKPTFEIIHVKPKDNVIAEELQGKMKLYLTEYFNSPADAEPVTYNEQHIEDDEQHIPEDAYLSSKVAEVEKELADENWKPTSDAIEDLPF